MRVKRNGFTIVEMLMVIGVLAILTGLVTVAATSAIRQARVRRADALANILQNGIATFYAQNGYWPPKKSGQLQTWAEDGLDAKYTNKGLHAATLEDDDYDELMYSLVRMCLDGQSSPIMDVTGFTATAKSAAQKKDPATGLPKCYGQEVRNWVTAKRAKNGRGTSLRLSEMTFGYSEKLKGYFRRFKIKYNAESDSVTVEK